MWLNDQQCYLRARNVKTGTQNFIHVNLFISQPYLEVISNIFWMGCEKFTQKKCYCDFTNKLCISPCANDFFFQKRICCDLSKLLYVKIMKQNLIFWCQLSIKSLLKNMNLMAACRILHTASEDLEQIQDSNAKICICTFDFFFFKGMQHMLTLYHITQSHLR